MYEKEMQIIQDYLAIPPYDIRAEDKLELYKYGGILGIDVKNIPWYSYPRVRYGQFMYNEYIEVRDRAYTVMNSTTGYVFTTKQAEKDKCYIRVRLATGRLMFVDANYYDDTEDIWQSFEDKLLSYKPLDYDKINHTYIYNLECGKNLIADWQSIMETYTARFAEKKKEIDRQRKMQYLDRLKKELEEE